MGDLVWSFLKELRSDSGSPYSVQAYMELGTNGWGYNLVDGTYLTPTQVLNVNFFNTRQRQFLGLYPQDRGQLMKDFCQWTVTQDTQSMIFVYAFNDPWTAGAFDANNPAAASNPHIVKVVDPISTHTDDFLSPGFTATSRQTIIDALNAFLR